MDILAGVRAALGPDIAIFADSGIRSGADIAIALALGADGCLIGRPYLYGLGAAGEAGVDAVISILGAELRRCMALLGVAKIADVRACGEQLVRRM
jgi:L-lactate dehydrogenase (cytochrome)